jgi:hypothetical protein
MQDPSYGISGNLVCLDVEQILAFLIFRLLGQPPSSHLILSIPVPSHLQS